MNIENLTNEEFLQYNITDEKIAKRFSNLLDDIEQSQNKNVKNDKRIETLLEQIYFVRELIEELQNWSVENLSKAKLKQFNSLIDNSSFEC